jgi:hypothetical protein
MDVLQNPVNFTAFPASVLADTGVATTVGIRAMALGQPLKGANVTWFTKTGTITAISNRTDVNGLAEAVFSSNTATNTHIFAIVSTPLTGQANLTIPATIVNPPAAPKQSILHAIGPYLWIIVVVVVLAVAVVFYMFYWRPRSKRSKTEPEETQPYDELEEMPEGGTEGGIEGGDEGIIGGPPAEAPTEPSPETEEGGSSQPVGENPPTEDLGPPDETT